MTYKKSGFVVDSAHYAPDCQKHANANCITGFGVSRAAALLPPLSSPWPATVSSLNGKGGDDQRVRVFVCAWDCTSRKGGGKCARGRSGRILARGRVYGGEGVEPYDTSSE